MVKVIKSIISRKLEDLVKLKYKTGIIFGNDLATQIVFLIKTDIKR